MFRINRTDNRITPLQVKSFSELDFKERDHLQEWLAFCPDALGEELLIIQKEFAGFTGTKERLDLLALDKDGNLVVIENKLDDSGRDVVWQALKYASYCANLSKSQVVEIFQKHLKHDEDAESKICEFLDADDINEVKINTGNSQRLVFVAANFPKEVTNTALWLLRQGISIQCFRATPYAFGEELLLKIDQIIPTPEAEEFMVGMKAKEDEEKFTEAALKHRERVRLAFWEETLKLFGKSECRLFESVNPSKNASLGAGSGVALCPFMLGFLKTQIRVELYLGRRDIEENKFLFSELQKQKEKIEKSFGEELVWNEMEGNKASRIQFRKSFDEPFDCHNQENWPEMIEWLISKMTLLEKALKKPLSEAASKLKVL